MAPAPHFTHSLPSVLWLMPPPWPTARSLGASPLRSSSQVLGSLLCHPKGVVGDGHGVPIPCPPHPKGSHHGQGRVCCPRDRAAMAITASEDGGTLGTATQLPPSPAHPPLTECQSSPNHSSGPRLSSLSSQGGGGGRSWGAHLLSSSFPWNLAGPWKGLGAREPGCNNKSPLVRTAAHWCVLISLRFPLPATALSFFCFSCSRGSPQFWPPRICR